MVAPASVSRRDDIRSSRVTNRVCGVRVWVGGCRYVNDEERFTGKVSVLKDLNFCNRHDGTDRYVAE